MPRFSESRCMSKVVSVFLLILCSTDMKYLFIFIVLKIAYKHCSFIIIIPFECLAQLHLKSVLSMGLCCIFPIPQQNYPQNPFIMVLNAFQKLSSLKVVMNLEHIILLFPHFQIDICYIIIILWHITRNHDCFVFSDQI